MRSKNVLLSFSIALVSCTLLSPPSLLAAADISRETGSANCRDWGHFNPSKFQLPHKLVPSATVTPAKARRFQAMPAFPHDPCRTNIIYGRGQKELPTEIYAKAYDILQIGRQYYQAPGAGESKQIIVKGQPITIYGMTWYTPLPNNEWVGNPVQVSPFDPTRVFYKDKDMWPSVVYGEPGKEIMIANRKFTVPPAGETSTVIIYDDGRSKQLGKDGKEKTESAGEDSESASSEPGSASEQVSQGRGSSSGGPGATRAHGTGHSGDGTGRAGSSAAGAASVAGSGGAVSDGGGKTRGARGGQPEKSPSDKVTQTPEKTDEKTPEKLAEKALEKLAEKTPEKLLEKSPEKLADKPSEKPIEKVPEGSEKSSKNDGITAGGGNPEIEKPKQLTKTEQENVQKLTKELMDNPKKELQLNDPSTQGADKVTSSPAPAHPIAESKVTPRPTPSGEGGEKGSLPELPKLTDLPPPPKTSSVVDDKHLATAGGGNPEIEKPKQLAPAEQASLQKLTKDLSENPIKELRPNPEGIVSKDAQTVQKEVSPLVPSSQELGAKMRAPEPVESGVASNPVQTTLPNSGSMQVSNAASAPVQAPSSSANALSVQAGPDVGGTIVATPSNNQNQNPSSPPSSSSQSENTANTSFPMPATNAPGARPGLLGGGGGGGGGGAKNEKSTEEIIDIIEELVAEAERKKKDEKPADNESDNTNTSKPAEPPPVGPLLSRTPMDPPPATLAGTAHYKYCVQKVVSKVMGYLNMDPPVATGHFNYVGDWEYNDRANGLGVSHTPCTVTYSSWRVAFEDGKIFLLVSVEKVDGQDVTPKWRIMCEAGSQNKPDKELDKLLGTINHPGSSAKDINDPNSLWFILDPKDVEKRLSELPGGEPLKEQRGQQIAQGGDGSGGGSGSSGSGGSGSSSGSASGHPSGSNASGNKSSGSGSTSSTQADKSAAGVQETTDANKNQKVVEPKVTQNSDGSFNVPVPDSEPIKITKDQYDQLKSMYDTLHPAVKHEVDLLGNYLANKGSSSGSSSGSYTDGPLSATIFNNVEKNAATPINQDYQNIQGNGKGWESTPTPYPGAAQGHSIGATGDAGDVSGPIAGGGFISLSGINPTKIVQEAQQNNDKTLANPLLAASATAMTDQQALNKAFANQGKVYTSPTMAYYKPTGQGQVTNYSIADLKNPNLHFDADGEQVRKKLLSGEAIGDFAKSDYQPPIPPKVEPPTNSGTGTPSNSGTGTPSDPLKSSATIIDLGAGANRVALNLGWVRFQTEHKNGQLGGSVTVSRDIIDSMSVGQVRKVDSPMGNTSSGGLSERLQGDITKTDEHTITFRGRLVGDTGMIGELVPSSSIEFSVNSSGGWSSSGLSAPIYGKN